MLVDEWMKVIRRLDMATTATAARVSVVKRGMKKKYKPERCKIGDTATCARYGLMLVTNKNRKGYAIGRKIAPVVGHNLGAPSIILTPTIVRLIKNECTAVVSELVGVTGPTVNIWRRALGITFSK